MRILVAHNVPRSRNGGMSRIMGFIHDEIERSGNTVDWLCNEDVPRAYNNRWQRFGFPWLVFQRARSAAAAGMPYHIVNVHEPSGAAIALLKRWAGGPRVAATSHGLECRGWRVQVESGVPLRTRILYPATSLWQSNLTDRLADHVFCLNHEDRDFLIEHRGRAPETVTRIFPAADAIYGRAAASRDYSRFRTLLFAGTWIARKGIEETVAAFGSVANQFPDLRLTVLGGFFPIETIRSAFPESLRHRVAAIQAANDEENAAAYAAADAMLLPSHFEGTPLTLMEAMASGLPVITTSTCGMKDVIEHGRNGLLVPVRATPAVSEAIARLASDPGLRERLGRAAHDDATRRYTWQASAECVGQAYRAILQRRP